MRFDHIKTSTHSRIVNLTSQLRTLNALNQHRLVISMIFLPTLLFATYSLGAGDQILEKVYWASWHANTTHKIQRANPDITEVEDLIVSDFRPYKAIQVDVAGGKMYLMSRPDFGASAYIGRANIDGSGFELLITGGLTFPISRTLALDVDGGKMYWVDSGVIFRANLDGSGIEPIYAGLNNTGGLALDVAADKIYWTDNLGGGIHAIRRVNLDGTGFEEILSINTGWVWSGVAVDPVASKVYWSGGFDDSGIGIYRVNIDGTDVELLVEVNAAEALALDVEGGWIYYIESGKLIKRAPINGGNGTIVANNGGSNQAIFASLSLDLLADKMYYTVQGGDSHVERRNLDGSQQEIMLTALAPLSEIESFDIEELGGKMYWVDEGARRIQRANLDGTGVEDIFTGLEASGIPQALAIDSINGRFFWSDNESIKSADLDGANEFDLGIYGEGGRVNSIRLDVAAEKLYFTRYDGAGQTPHGVFRANLDGSDLELVIQTAPSNGGRISGLALNRDENKMYWIDHGVGFGPSDILSRANLDGTGNVEEIIIFNWTSASGYTVDLDTTAGKIYIVRKGAQFLMRANLDGTAIEQFPMEGSIGTVSLLFDPGNTCPADLDGSGAINTSDLLELFAAWGKNPGNPADLDGDGTVNTVDLLILFANWGPCP